MMQVHLPSTGAVNRLGWKRYFILMLGLLIFCCEAVGRQAQLEFIPIMNRPAESLIQLVRPFLDPGETVVASGSQLILKVDPAKLSEIRTLVRQLDKSLHRLLISVKQGEELTTDSLNAGVSVRAHVPVNRPSRSRITARGTFSDTNADGTDNSVQTIQTLDGRPAIIKMGTDNPIHSFGLTPYGAVIQGTTYRETTTGFSVLPRLVGERVLLEISPWSERISRRGDGTVNTRSAITTLRTAVGRWIEIGGNVNQSTERRSGTFSYSKSTRKRSNKIFIKVEDLDVGIRQ